MSLFETPKFQAGDMIINKDQSEGVRVLMVNRAYVDLGGNSRWMYSLDNGDGFYDARATVDSIDSEFELCK